MAISIHGGPKPQSILNNAKHKEYIDCRSRESATSVTKVAESKTEFSYPATDLDQRTRRYIDGLRQRNLLLENTMQELKQRLKIETTENPIDIGVLLGKEPTLEMDNDLSPEAKKALLILISELPHISDSVELFENCSLRHRTGDWILKPAIYKEIMNYLEPKSKL